MVTGSKVESGLEESSAGKESTAARLSSPGERRCYTCSQEHSENARGRVMLAHIEEAQFKGLCHTWDGWQ